MNNRLCCSPVRPEAATSKARVLLQGWIGLGIAAAILAYAPSAVASDAPAWIHALVNVPLPAHDEKTDAVMLFSLTQVNVVSADKIKVTVRRAYKILRPQGRERGLVLVHLNSNRKITSLHGWCIPAQGKDYEVKDKEAVEVAPPMIEGGELIRDVKYRVMDIPAPDPGNVIGYEYEVEETPLVLQSSWSFQGDVPVRESRFFLQLPAGWEYKASWLNYPEVKPTPGSNNPWEWVVTDVKAVRQEAAMPPREGLEGQMVISFLPPGGPALNGFSNWQQMGNWYRNLTIGRTDASPEIKQKAAALTSAVSSPLDKMRALAQ